MSANPLVPRRRATVETRARFTARPMGEHTYLSGRMARALVIAQLPPSLKPSPPSRLPLRNAAGLRPAQVLRRPRCRELAQARGAAVAAAAHGASLVWHQFGGQQSGARRALSACSGFAAAACSRSDCWCTATTACCACRCHACTPHAACANHGGGCVSLVCDRTGMIIAHHILVRSGSPGERRIQYNTLLVAII